MADDNKSIFNWQRVDPADAMPFGAATTPQGSPTMLSGMLGGIMDIPKHLIDAAKVSATQTYGAAPATQKDSEVQSDPLPAQAAQTAMMLAGGGAPAAEAGAAGIFGGKLAQTADIKALIEANKMRSANESVSRIKNDTGWFNTPTDSKWKFEIPDDGARINTQGALDWGQHGDWMGGPSSLIFEHPKLYKAYPQLGDMQAYVTAGPQRAGEYNPGNSQRIFNPKQAQITLEGPDAKTTVPVGIHEMQHAIQDIEHFATGGTPSNMAYMQEKTPAKLPLGTQGEDPYELYRKLAGEVEARNVDLRYRDPSLRSKPPWETQEYPYNEQLVYNPVNTMVRSLRHLK